jgi:cytochrome c oxidase assembly protein subunit 15
MTIVRRLAYAALFIGYTHTVFGAIVRITGSGLGCGNHWPDCNNQLWPGVGASSTVLIEYTHRILAAALLATVLALVILSSRNRDARAVRAVRAPALVALGLVITAAVVGAIVVKLDLADRLVVLHYGIAMLTLATLVVAVVRAGGLGASTLETGAASARTYRGAGMAALLAFIVVLLGAATANVPGAAQSCIGFPVCRIALIHGTPLVTQMTHRVLAFLLLFHVFGVALAVRKRHEDPRIILASRVAFAVIVLQILVAAALVELRLPPPLQSLHQAVGTLVWITIFAFATLARVGAGVGDTSARVPAPQPVTAA